MNDGSRAEKARRPRAAGEDIVEITAERGIFLCVDGKGEPSDDALRRTRELLYTVARRLRRRLVEMGGPDFKLPRLERLASGGTDAPIVKEPAWRLLLGIPEEVTRTHLLKTRRELMSKRGIDAAAVKRVSWREGRALETIYSGPRRGIEAAFDRLRARAGELGYRVKGPRHEIFISLPDKAETAVFKSILRLPVSWPRPDYAR